MFFIVFVFFFLFHFFWLAYEQRGHNRPPLTIYTFHDPGHPNVSLSQPVSPVATVPADGVSDSAATPVAGAAPAPPAPPSLPQGPPGQGPASPQNVYTTRSECGTSSPQPIYATLGEQQNTVAQSQKSQVG